MKILIACEESQAVCKEFRRLGHEAFSCDIIECSGGHPEWHIQGDALKVLNPSFQTGFLSPTSGTKFKDWYGLKFTTCDGKTHEVQGRWDMVIAHPPCTYLSNAGAARLYKKVNGKSYCEVERLNKGLDAKAFFMAFYNADCDRIAIENPVPSGIYRLPPYQQIIQPYEHGDPYSKKTCLWLKGLAPLRPTNVVEPICSWVSGGSKKADGTPRENKGTRFRDACTRSKTFPGIAKAMAAQWGDVMDK